jgi:SAM-dependent methyltransferase
MATPSGAARFVNRTRRSPSIPRKLIRERKVHLLPLYALLLGSDLAREGVAHSGSYRFADHLYRAVPSGRWGVGTLLDALLLRLPSARSFRSRYVHARDAAVHVARRRAGQGGQGGVRVLSVPCGVARELADAAALLRDAYPSVYPRVEWTGLDLDPDALALSAGLIRERGLERFTFRCGDALDPGAYPERQDLVTCTGLGEFLADDELVRLYAHCRAALREGGWLVTSATRRHRLSDYLLRNLGELRAHYREGDDLRRLLGRAGFRHVHAWRDILGYQTLAVAVAA